MSEQGPEQSAVRMGMLELLTYVWDYHTYVHVLRTDSETLKANLSNVQKEVEDAHSKHHDIKQEVVKWLDDGNKELEITETLLESLDSLASCWARIFPCEHNCKHRYTLAKRAESHSKEIKKLMKRCSFEGGVFLELKQPLPLTPTMQSSYKALPSREKYLEKIMEALHSTDKLVIGVYGAEGVGKTMLVKRLALAIESGGVFNGVTMTAMGDWSWLMKQAVDYMQIEMAHRIGLTLTKQSLNKAESLKNKLMSMEKVVIIVYKAEKGLDLNKIGIPWPDNNNGCRIVVVSTSLDVCMEMKTHINFEIEPLCQEEAVHLFDELAKECKLTHTTKILQAKDGILSKFLWTPGEIRKLVDALQNILLLPPASIVATDGSAKKTLMLGAETLGIWDTPRRMRWLTPSPSTSSLKVAEFIICWAINIRKEVREEWLSPATNYAAYFIYQLTSQARDFNSNSPVTITVGNRSKTCFLDPSTAASKTLERGGVMPKRRKDGWLEIELGIFFNIGHSGAVVNLSVEDFSYEIKSGFLVQGFEMRPLD